jgi:hypothetical protein
VQAAKLKPHCLFSGDTSSDIFKFLIANNVTILQHVPAWREELLAKARPLMALNTRHSHLYAHEDALIGTFQRVDIPMLSTLRQYNFVFFTVRLLTHHSLQPATSLPMWTWQLLLAGRVTSARPSKHTCCM